MQREREREREKKRDRERKRKNRVDGQPFVRDLPSNLSPFNPSPLIFEGQASMSLRAKLSLFLSHPSLEGCGDLDSSW